MEHVSNTKALFIILNAGFADDVIEIARNAGARGATIFNARGEVTRHELFMGITVDAEKEIILCIVNEETSVKVMTSIKEKKGITTPAHCVCFTLPVETVVGLSMEPPQTKK